MRIVALSVFEGVIYHCHPVDLRHPCRPTLEVDARTQPGDLDAGPLMMTLSDYVPCLGEITVLAGRLRLSCEINDVPPALVDAVEAAS